MVDILEFIEPFYSDKDIMHDMTHIERVKFTADELMGVIDYDFNLRVVEYAIYFHGFIYSHESEILGWLKANGFEDSEIDFVVQTAWDSQKENGPRSMEGKLVHDAHMIEGGKTYLIVKSLITGSVRNQSLIETIKYIDSNVLGKGKCYLAEAQVTYVEQQSFAEDFMNSLRKGIGYVF